MKSSTPRHTRLPAIPEIARTPDAIHRALQTLKEATEVGLGRRGDPLDRFATLRELQDAGLVQVSIGGDGAVLTRPGGPGTGAPIGDGDPGPPDFGDDDFTPPPKPLNVRARGLPPDTDPTQDAGSGQQNRGIVMVTWDEPNYHNHYYAEVYRVFQNAPPLDQTGRPLLAIELTQLNVNYAHGVDAGDGSPNLLGSNRCVFAGTAAGTVFVDAGLGELFAPQPGQELDAALNPGSYFYWVRFVSRAMVPGPFSDRAEGALSINPTRVLDAMTRSITDSPLFANLRGWLALGSPEAQEGSSILEYIQNEVAENRISQMWSVRMGARAGGLVFTSGFGLGMETVRNEEGDWESLSTFLVNANQFAIMGPNTLRGGSIITEFQASGTSLTLRLQSGQHGFVVMPEGDPRQRAVLMIPEGDIRIPDPFDPDAEPMIVPVPAWLTELAGVELEVVGVSVTRVDLTTVLDARSPQNTEPQGDVYPPLQLGFISETLDPRMGCALLPGANIPFIVDTARSVVGIRGSLIVDGLVRATEGEFNTLVANTAFIRQLQAQVVNANVVIGQRIIAGTPGTGTIDQTDYNAISNYIVELNNPVVSQYPLRYYKPSTGDHAFDVDRLGNLHVGGHMTVEGSGVIAGGAAAGSDVIFSSGGSGADTGPNSRYALWIGQKQNYGGTGEGRSEANGFMWVKSNGRAGFNADVFLGENALTLPTLAAGNNSGAAIVMTEGGPRAGSIVLSSVTNQAIRVRPLRSGQAAIVSVTASGLMYSHGTGGGASKRFRVKLQLVGSPTAQSGVLVQEFEIDDWYPETWPFSLCGAVEVPAGDYYVRIDLANIEDRPMSIIRGWNAIAMQVSANGALGGNPTQIPYQAPAAAPSLPVVEAPPTPPVDLHLAAEALYAGAYVQITAGGLALADAATGKAASGYVLDFAEEGQFVRIHTDGFNTRLEGLEVGETYCLSQTVPGGVVKRIDATVTPGEILQVLGVALSDTAIDTEIGEPTVRG